MKITDLDERTIFFIDSILIYFHNDDRLKKQYQASDIYQRLIKEIKDITFDNIYDCLKLIDEFLNVGKIHNGSRSFIVDNTRLNIFQSNGGIRKLIEREKSDSEQSEEKSLLEINSLKLQVGQLKYESERRKSQIEIDKLTIKNLKRNNKILAFFFVITLIGWMVDFASENAQWGWSIFQEKSQIETPVNKSEKEILSSDSLQSNQYNNQQTNDTIE